jgi:HTH-like domain
MKSDYPILILCEHLEVSPSGYYDWLKRRTAPGPRALANQTLAQQIKAIHAQSRQTYGSPRILNELRKQGMPPWTQSRCPPHAGSGVVRSPAAPLPGSDC